MSISPFAFDPADGLANTTAFPQKPADQTAARGQFMTLFNQLRDYLNSSIIPAILPTDGWIPTSYLFSYASADAPSFVLSTTGDATSRYYPGCRLRLTQDGVIKYFIVHAVSYTAPNTSVTVYGGTDYTLTTTVVSNVSFALPKTYPLGFPIDPGKWSIEVSNTTTVSPSALSTGYYPMLTQSLPIGEWVCSCGALMFVSCSSQTNLSLGISTSATSWSDPKLQFGGAVFLSNTGTYHTGTNKIVILTAKTNVYLVCQIQYGTPSGVQFVGSIVPTSFKAVDAYL